MGADALANAPVGGSLGTSLSYRFRAARSGTLSGIRKSLIWSDSKSGYSAGTGGTLHFQLWTDDGTAAHNPGSSIAGATADSIHPPTNGAGLYPLLTFNTPPSVTAGGLYHLVITNTDASPSLNFASANDLWTNGAFAPAQPTVSDLDWALLARSSGTGNNWILMQSHLPSLEFIYGDGSTQGRGWIDVWASAPKPISGSSGVRERILVAGGNKVVTAAYLRLKLISGSSPLVLRLENSSGTLVDSITVPASQIPVIHHWVGGAFAAPRTLADGQVYYLTAQTASDTRLESFPIRDGAFAGNGDFHEASTFGPSCWAEFNAGSGWAGWNQGGGTNRVDVDLQFYFVLQ